MSPKPKSLKKNAKTSEPELAASLANFLCFAVYSTNLAFNRAYKPFLDELGITYPQYVTLIALNEQANQTVSELGAKLFLESSTLTPLLKRLEAMGFLTRTRDAEDERQVRINLTDEGRGVFEKAFCTRGPLIEATGLDQEAFVRLQRDLVTLRDNLLRSSAR